MTSCTFHLSDRLRTRARSVTASSTSRKIGGWIPINCIAHGLYCLAVVLGESLGHFACRKCARKYAWALYVIAAVLVVSRLQHVASKVHGYA